MAAIYTSNAATTIAAGITSGATSISVVDGGAFPSPTGGNYAYATLEDASHNIEIVKITARSGNTLTVVRAQDSTTAKAFVSGSRFELRVTAVGLNEFLNANNNLSDLADPATALSNIGAAAAVHTHTIANVTGLQTALDGKALSAHTHSIANVTGLQTALDGKASITDFTVSDSLPQWTNGGFQYHYYGSDHVAYVKKAGAFSYYWRTSTSGLDNTGNVTLMTLTDSGNLATGGSVTAGGSVGIGTGGAYAAGSIYSDANWGMIFRAKQASPALTEFMWANSAGTELMRLSASALKRSVADEINIGAVASQRVITSYGWNDGVIRWRSVLESDAAFAWYTYNSSGAFVDRYFCLHQDGTVTGKGARRLWETATDGASTNFVQGTTANRTGSITSGDWNTAIPSGFFESSGGTNAPGSNWWWGINVRHSSTGNQYGWQMLGSIDTDVWKVRRVSNGSWGSWLTLYHSGNDGTGSGLDADLWQGYGRNNLTLSGPMQIHANNPYLDIVNMGTGDPSLLLRTGSRYDRIYNSSTGLKFGHNYSGTESVMVFNASGLTVDGSVITPLITGVNVNSRDKLRVWSGSPYSIGMDAGYSYGGLGTEYAMTFQMNDADTRGFWWGKNTHTNAQGAMSLTMAGVLTINASGTGTNWLATSDRRGKTDEKPFVSALEAIRKLEPKWFKWTLGPKEGQEDFGFISQEVEALFPSLIEERTVYGIEDFKYLDYGRMTTIAIAGIKEQQKVIDDLKSELAEIKEYLRARGMK